jgi:hypothetical protein
MNIIVKMKFGSHLYGTSTPNSDTDIKGIFLPDVSDVINQTVPKSIKHNTSPDHVKNTKDDVDEEYYSIHHFFKLLTEGQVVALDMLFAPDSVILEKSHLWDRIRANTHIFLSKNTYAFTGYCKTQAAKYGIKGSRVAAVRSALASVSELAKKTTMVPYKHSDGYAETESMASRPLYEKLSDCFTILPEGEHIEKYVCEVSKQPTYEVCGRKFQGTCKLDYVKNCLQQVLDSYGARALQAEKNENIDWKAVSHAFRVCYEAIELLRDHKITFPLPQASFILRIKQGKLHYKNDDVAERLDALMNEAIEASNSSTLPEKPDYRGVKNLLNDIYSTLHFSREINRIADELFVAGRNYEMSEVYADNKEHDDAMDNLRNMKGRLMDKFRSINQSLTSGVDDGR